MDTVTAPARPVARTLVAAAALSVLCACGGPVETTAAPDASDPACATLMAALPASLDGLRARETTGRGTAAWGDPPIVLFCGVEPPGPTSDSCVAVGSDITVDWIMGESDGAARFTTFGRFPSVQVSIPDSVADGQGAAFLVDLADAISRIPQTDHCE